MKNTTTHTTSHTVKTKDLGDEMEQIERSSAMDDEHESADNIPLDEDVRTAMPFDGDYHDAVAWCEETADDYGSAHAAMVDLLFAPPEDYENPWMQRLWEVAEFVRAQPCTCDPADPDGDECPRCHLLNPAGHGR